MKAQIWPRVQDYAVSFEHVGSTYVPGLAAKPVIDIDIVVDDARRLSRVIQSLESIGFVHRGNRGIERREAFRTPECPIKYNLYACIKDCLALRNHLLLRQHFRTNPLSRDEYSKLKQHLASTTKSKGEYLEGKTSFLIEILSKHGFSTQELEDIRKSNQESKRKLIIKASSQEAELWDENKLLKACRISTALRDWAVTMAVFVHQ